MTKPKPRVVRKAAPTVLVEPQPPWWQTLPLDYYLRRDGTALDTQHRLKIRGTAAVDRVLRTGLGSLICAAMAPRLLRSRDALREFGQLAFYQSFADRGRADEVYAKPPGGIKIRVAAPRGNFRLRGGSCRALSFESPFSTLNPELSRSYAGYSRNRVARALHFTHDDRPRPTLVFLHGYSLDSYRINSWGMSMPWFFRQGYDVLLATLPFHGARAERWHPFSGYGYFAGGLAHSNEAMLQSVMDTRVWLDYLLTRGAPQVGVSGLSLGGYLSALLIAVDPRLAFSIPNSPVVVPIDMAMQWQPMGNLLRLMMRRTGYTLGQLRHGTALHSPLTYAPQADPSRLLIISGAGDRFTAPVFVRLLHEHWQGSHMHWFPGNHLLHFQQGDYLRLMKTFMDQHCGSAPARRA